MDSSQILQMLADFGALGLASGAIFWLYLKMAKRMDALTDNFQKQLKEQMEAEIPMILKNDMIIQFHEERLIDLEERKNGNH